LVLLQWREAECLALRPHSFSRLKQLPELRQIISHAAVPAIASCAGQLQQLAAAAQTQLDAERDAEVLAEVEEARKRGGAAAEQALPRHVLKRVAAIEARKAAAAKAAGRDATAAAAAAAATAAGGESELFSQEIKDEVRKDMLDEADASLLQHLAPGLRLCLAAEVAVGMLCEG
jgi:hypothetical protein